MKLVTILLFLFVAPLTYADSIVMDAQTIAPDGSIHQVRLVPGVDQLLVVGHAPDGGLVALTLVEQFVGPLETSVLTWTLVLSNLSTPLVINFPPGGTCGAGGFCALIDSFMIPTTFVPVSGTLTVHFNDEIETFSFHYISTVPEPSSMILLGTGVIAVGMA